MADGNRLVRALRGRVLALFELTLIAVGAMAVGWYNGVHVAAAREQTRLADELEASQTALSSAARAPVTHAPDARAPVTHGVPRLALAPRSVVARIQVPRLNLSAVAREGDDQGTLGVAVGHVPGTALPGSSGNAAFAAHRDTFFRPLRRVHKGDEVLVTTPRGKYRYRVTSIQVVKPDDISVLDPTALPTLTLVTCYPFNYIGSAPYRFIVRAALLPR